ncbi:MAG: cation diffusion facilitator family transporter [Acidimicrobiia bacterium]
MSGDHNHGISVRAGARYKRRLWLVLWMVLAFLVIQVITGILSGSLALLSDAGHMGTDALGLGMALAAITAADKASSGNHRTFGLYRLEILAALANAVLLFGVAGFVLYEASRRFQEPPEILSGPMLVVALLGLAVNVTGWRLLREGAAESLNMEGAFLEVIADLIGSLGVVAAALIVRYTGWLYADPIIGAGIGLFILPRAYRLGRKAIRVLVQAAPDNLDIVKLRTQLGAIQGVEDVHDLHVWTLTSDMPVASVHLMTDSNTDREAVLEGARRLLRDDFEIAHATLQVELGGEECSELTW